MSEEKIGEAVIKEVIGEELRELPLENVPPITPYLPVQVKSEQDQKMITQLAKMIRIVGDRVKDDKEFQDAIDGVPCLPGPGWERFKDVAFRVFEHGVTWERIAVLFYVAGKLAAKMVQAHLPQSLKELVSWILDFFRKNLLGWIQKHGGWINSFSALAAAPVRGVSSSSVSFGLVVFATGLIVGSFITWRLTRT